MGQLQVTPWRRYGHRRLYVKLPDGQSAAWFDEQAQQLTVLLETHRDAVLEALAAYLTQQPPPPASPTPPATAPALPEPIMSLAPPAPAPPVGWTPEVPPPPAAPSAPPLALPAAAPTSMPRPSPPSTWPPSAVGQAGAALSPEHDLAANRPGAALRVVIKERAPGFWRALRDRLLRRPSELESWRKGLRGEEMAGAELERLTRRGWRVLHSILVAENVDIDHLLIGPGGVFTVNTKHHARADVWVGDHVVKVQGYSHQYLPKARAEARRTAAMLTRSCGFTVPVDAALIFVLPGQLTLAPPRGNPQAIRVHTLRHTHIATFNQFPRVWQPDQVERIYAAARDRRNWLDL